MAPRSAGWVRASTPITILSLFILLLVFFAVLGANAEWRTHRSEPVLRSVERQFGGQAAGELRDADRAWQMARTALQSVGELLRTEFPIAKVTSEEGGSTWYVAVPASALFEAGDTAIRPERRGLLTRAARVLAAPPSGLRYRVAALMALAGPVEPGPGSVERAAALGAALIGGGAPADSVSIGLEAGQPGMVRLFFGVEPVPEPVP